MGAGATEPGLGAFFEEVARSLSAAQASLTAEVPDIPTAVAISDAELEVKATLRPTKDGGFSVETLSAKEIREIRIDPGALSTIRVRLTPVPEDPLAPPSSRPERSAAEVIDEVRVRPDVAALDRILDGLSFDAVFLRGTRRRVVTAADVEGRLVREVVLPDERR